MFYSSSSFPLSVPSNVFSRSAWARHSYAQPSQTGLKVTKFQVKTGRSVSPISMPSCALMEQQKGCIKLVSQWLKGRALPIDTCHSWDCFRVTQNAGQTLWLTVKTEREENKRKRFHAVSKVNNKMCHKDRTLDTTIFLHFLKPHLLKSSVSSGTRHACLITPTWQCSGL